jgi:hypothetical protein
MSEKADLGGSLKTSLTLEAGDDRICIAVDGTALSVTEFMELVEMLLVNAKYDKSEVEAYVLQWAEDIKVSKGN